MSGNINKASIIFSVYQHEQTLSYTSEGSYDETTVEECDYGPDFASLEEAVAWAKAEAAKDRPEIRRGAYGYGYLSRNVYEICAAIYDADEEEWVPCTSTGEEAEFEPAGLVAEVDALDLYPELRKAWEKERDSYWHFLDYDDEDAFIVDPYDLEEIDNELKEEERGDG